MSDIPNNGDEEVTVVPTARATGIVAVVFTNQKATYATVKGSAGQVYGYHIYNPNTVDIFVQFYNNAAPTVGTTAAVMILFVPPGGGVDGVFPIGIAFSAAITLAATTTSTGSTAPTTGLLVNVWGV